MIRTAGDTLSVAGPMTLAGASALLAEGAAAIKASCRRVDLASVTAVDSSGLAVVFGWIRAARSDGFPLSIVNPPQNLLSLAQVYGVADLLPLG